MGDALATGAERVERQCHANPGLMIHESIAADPGVQALVEYVVDDDCVCKDLKRIAEMAGQSGQHPDLEVCGRCAALKTWEHGDG